MGVPKFFRYISERYPCLSELAREQSIPDFDNLYLDMNGIIHNCSHPDDSNFHFTITEEEIMKDIFNYIDKLFFLIKPQKIFFMAVDGVAPRAKMNQQRSRRFRSAKDAELLEQKAKNRGEVREHQRFDSNCITPGTEFMVRLHEALRYFIKSKISSDPLWQKCRIILSGHDFPGEGEHKIMSYIRYLKSGADYNPNTRHCLYGLDADLIILGLCTHELHFVVLREEVKFGRKANKTSVEETRFFLLHLGLLREYLELEFHDLRQVEPSFDIAKVLDDWVLMGFLVGNDFIPHLPCLHISSNALPLLYKTYIKAYPSLGGNINENGKLNLERLEKYFAALSDVEFDIFHENYADLKYFQAKQSKNGTDEAFDFDVNDIASESNDNDLAALIESSRQLLDDHDDDSSDESNMLKEFETFKRNYYMNKLNHADISKETKLEHAIHYITALQWILDYYYCGVQSWDWYYPYHYAPFISDLKDFKDYEIKFNMGKPFLPFQQLLAVLPAASQELLPSAYRDLMTSANSKLIDFYPCNFETDLNGKKHDWEAVVLIPFLDEDLLLDAMKSCESKLTASEVDRNKHGPMLQYDYNAESQGNVPGIYSLKGLYHVFCTEEPQWLNEFAIFSNKTVPAKWPYAAQTTFFPGFPTMRHLKYDFRLKTSRVKVFDHPSRGESLILLPQNRAELANLINVAEKYLNQIIYIGWPHLIKAKVVAVSDADQIIELDGTKGYDQKLFQQQVKSMQEHLITRMGIEYDDFSVMIHTRINIGYKHICGNHGNIDIVDVWAPTTTVYPAQGIVSEISVHNAVRQEYKKIEELFPLKSTVFFVGNPYFGSEGIISDPMLVYECGRLKVEITVLAEPDFSIARTIQAQLEMDYVSLFQAATQIGIHYKCLGRLTGTILVVAGARRGNVPENIAKSNIGLKLKLPKQQEERAGYARRRNNQWLLSSKAIALIEAYCKNFPMVIAYLSRAADRYEFCFETDLFPNEVGKGNIEKILAWLKLQEHNKADIVACASQTVEKESVEAVLNSIEELKTMPVKTVKLQVKPHLLIKPDISLSNIYKSNVSARLFDRIVVVKTTYMVPLGAKGTIIGIYPVCDPNPVRLECVKSVDTFLEILFDKPLPNGNDIYGLAQGRVYKVPEASVLIILQDPKKNEKYDSKKHDTVKEGPTTPSRSPNFAKPSLNTNINSNIMAISEPLSSTLQPPISNTNSEFWMPSVNTKIIHTRNIHNNDHQAKNNQKQNMAKQNSAPNSQPRKNASNECQAETVVLKNLLGLTQDNAPEFASTVPQQTNLPHPPQCWRNDAQTVYQQTHSQHISKSQTAADIAAMAIVPQLYPKKVPLAPNSFADPLQQICKPNENYFRTESYNQKGAFIPLQTVRGINRQLKLMCDNVTVPTHLHQNQATTVAKQITESDSSNAQTDVKIDKAAKPVDTFKKRRAPKIGAKFDMSFN